MNDSIVIYRYHDNFELVNQRIRLIKMIDPGIRVYGIYGGKSEAYGKACKSLNEVLDGNYLVRSEDPRWKWLHADITYKMWYREVGKYIDFNFVYVLEWDLLILEKLQHIYPLPSDDTVYFTGLIPIEKVSKFWYWNDKQNKPKVTEFFKKVRMHYKTEFEEYATLGPGLFAPRLFFEGLLELDLFEADVTDEVKIPVWSQLLGLQLKSNNFYTKWFSYFEMRYFNANVANIKTQTIRKEMSKKHGRRVFHPYRENLQAEVLFELYHNAKEKFGIVINNKIKHVNVIHPLTYKIHCKLLKLAMTNESGN